MSVHYTFEQDTAVIDATVDFVTVNGKRLDALGSELQSRIEKRGGFARFDSWLTEMAAEISARNDFQRRWAWVLDGKNTDNIDSAAMQIRHSVYTTLMQARGSSTSTVSNEIDRLALNLLGELASAIKSADDFA